MYEKTSTPPKAGSYREAVFLNVWLKRQDIELTKTRLMAQGFINPEEVKKVFEDYTRAVFPFFKGAEVTKDKELMEKMAKEVSKGPVLFKTVDPTTHLRPMPVQNLPQNIRNILQKKMTSKALK